MKEIKFRAWDKKGKKIRKVCSIAFDDYGNTKVINLWGTDLIEQKDIVLHREPKDIKLMEYTGLKDREDNEIYEGDIVVSHNDVVQGIVIYQAPEFVIKRKLTHKTWEGFILSATEKQYQKVIGNIYENPDLI